MTVLDQPLTLAADRISVGYRDRTVIDGLNLIVPAGRITAIVGANASGKSTLLRALARLVAPRAGQVRLDGTPLSELPTKQVARSIGLMPQHSTAPEGITVADLVTRGRYPHQSWWSRWSSADEDAVHDALRTTGLLELSNRPVAELSGGQRQRVWIALALAQQTDILLLDEPTTFLDVSHQIDVLDLIADLNRERGTTIVMVLHELNLAARYADHLVAMKDGQIAAAGSPAAVLDEALVRSVFGLASRIVDDPVTGGPLVVPVGRHVSPEDLGS